MQDVMTISEKVSGLPNQLWAFTLKIPDCSKWNLAVLAVSCYVFPVWLWHGHSDHNVYPACYYVDITVVYPQWFVKPNAVKHLWSFSLCLIILLLTDYSQSLLSEWFVKTNCQNCSNRHCRCYQVGKLSDHRYFFSGW